MNGSGHVIPEAEKTGGTPGAPEARRGRKEPPQGAWSSTLPSPWFGSRDSGYRISGLQDCQTIISAVWRLPGTPLQHGGTGANEQERPHTRAKTHWGRRGGGDIFGADTDT